MFAIHNVYQLIFYN